MLIKSIVFVMVFVFLSVALGRITTKKVNSEYRNSIGIVTGALLMFAIFYPIVMICTFLNCSLTIK